MRSSTAAASLLLMLVLVPARAQAQGASQAPTQQEMSQPPQTEDPSQSAEAQDPSQPPTQKPPAAVGEAGKKPLSNFPSALVHNLGDDLKHMPRRNSLYWLAAGSALALAVHPADKSINAHLATSKSADVLFTPGSYIGEGYVVLPAAAAVYLYGRYDDQPRVEHLGMDEIEGGLLGEGFVEGLKYIVRRPRPTPNTGQLTLASGYSFPSGHATLTFEAATILQQHLGYRAGIPTYLIATYVAMSRLHDNVHYASDVAFGAALGILIGRSVTWHGRNFWGENVSAPMPMMVRGGGGIMVTVRPVAAVSVPNR